jgi:hypothetical protein
MFLLTNTLGLQLKVKVNAALFATREDISYPHCGLWPECN